MLDKSILCVMILSLGLLVSCSDSPTGSEPEEEPTEEVGGIQVAISTTGEGTDEDGYSVVVGDVEQADVEINQTVLFPGLEEGTYSITLEGLAAGCSVDGENPVEAEMVTGVITTVAFDVVCEATTPQSDAEGTIAFKQWIDQDEHIFLMNADGGDKQQITFEGDNRSPVISPDGAFLMFTRQDPETTNHSIWVLDLGASTMLMENVSDPDEADYSPVWSPDGTQIAYQSRYEGNYSIWVMDADGSNPTPITDEMGNDTSPSWSSTGVIAFTSDRQGDDTEDIYTVDPDGENLELLIDAADDNGINLSDPAWSPDGSQIAYQGFANRGKSYIFIADADGSNGTMVTSDDRGAMQPTWSPDGAYLAFTALASPDNLDAVWIVSADGSQEIQLTDSDANRSSSPSWGTLN